MIARGKAMMNVLTHAGYSARIEFDPDDGILVGRVANIADGVTFHADNVAALKLAFIEAVDDYLETCRRIGKAPERPFSGNLMLRVKPSTHSKVATAAELLGKSLNQWG